MLLSIVALVQFVDKLDGQCLSGSPHFARWFKTLIIGSLGIRIRPPNGWSSSTIRRTAQATENAEATKARVLVALGGATRLKRDAREKVKHAEEVSAV